MSILYGLRVLVRSASVGISSIAIACLSLGYSCESGKDLAWDTEDSQWDAVANEDGRVHDTSDLPHFFGDEASVADTDLCFPDNTCCGDNICKEMDAVLEGECLDDRGCGLDSFCVLSSQNCVELGDIVNDCIDGPISIPEGISSTTTDVCEVSGVGTVSQVRIKVAVAHPTKGDLRLSLTHMGNSMALTSLGDSLDGIFETFSLPVGQSLADGEWVLTIDNIGVQGGELIGWDLAFIE